MAEWGGDGGHQAALRFHDSELQEEGGRRGKEATGIFLKKTSRGKAASPSGRRGVCVWVVPYGDPGRSFAPRVSS
jgi:hypothetical protein